MQPVGSQFFIFLLNWLRVSEFFIASGTISQVLGPLNERVSVPLNTVRTLPDTKGFLFSFCYISSRYSIDEREKKFYFFSRCCKVYPLNSVEKVLFFPLTFTFYPAVLRFRSCYTLFGPP